MNRKVLKSLFFFIMLTLLLVLIPTIGATNSTNNTSTAYDVYTTSQIGDIENTENVPVETINRNNENTQSSNSNTNLTNNVNSKTNSNLTVNDTKSSTNISNTNTGNNTIVKVDLSASTTKEGVMNIPLDKSRRIYFAMDHTNNRDRTICNNIVNRLKNAGFNVVRYTIGPNAMYQNMVYLYNHNIRNAIMFHLFNGVDPSNIREVARYGNDNRGRIVRSRGNDVVLAWFYDSGDCVHSSGSCYRSVRGSETGGRMSYPKNYMDQNNIYYICTSSDSRRHTSTADYTGTKTATEFMNLFNHDTVTIVTSSNVNQTSVTLSGTVTSNYAKNINGYITVKDSSSKVLVSNVKVSSGNFVAKFNLNNPGLQTISVNFLANGQHRASSTNVNIKIPKNVTISLSQTGNTIGYTKLDITVVDDKNKKAEANRIVYIKNPNGTISTVKTDSLGKASVNINSTKSETYEVYCNDENNKLLNSAKRQVTVNKNNAIITLEPIVSIIGEKITLKATFKDQYGNYISGGNMVFKLNGRTLRVDKKFNSNEAPLKFNVVNGIVTYTITADIYLRDAKNLSASYSGSYKYFANTSEVVTAQIQKRYVGLTVETSTDKVKAYEQIEFKATVRDITPKGTNSSLLNYKSYVMFKVNGKTLKDNNNNTLLVKVGKDNVARFNYTISPGTAGKTAKSEDRLYNVTAVFTSVNYYPDARNSTIYAVEQSPSVVNIKNCTYNNGTLILNANITDHMGNLTKGKSIVYLKINGKNYTEKNKIKYYSISGGIANITLSLKDANISNVTLCCLERESYLSSNSTVTVVKDEN